MLRCKALPLAGVPGARVPCGEPEATWMMLLPVEGVSSASRSYSSSAFKACSKASIWLCGGKNIVGNKH